MIPRIIHYCWFGRNPKPALAVKCMKSWKKYCRDYEIIEWNEDTFSIADAPLYVRQAYEAKKWAFVTDYVRLYALVNCGGVYMDTDVEVVKPLESYLQHHAFSGFESETDIQTGIMACEKGFPLFDELLHYYDHATFIKEDGSMDCTTNVEIITQACVEKGLQRNNTYQEIAGFAIYPKDVFCPKSHVDGIVRSTVNTHAIHHFNASWLDEEKRAEKNARWKRKQKKAKIKKMRASVKTMMIHLIGERTYKKLRGIKD